MYIAGAVWGFKTVNMTDSHVDDSVHGEELLKSTFNLSSSSLRTHIDKFNIVNIKKGFNNMDEFIHIANQVLNRRKSRAGKSLEHHLSALFKGNNLSFTSQGITEGKKRPDFIFPSVEAYHNHSFSVGKLTTLAAKTTCKDRWRQIINEADRLRDKKKFLCTMQQGISKDQLKEMSEEKVILVVPKDFISYYPKEYQSEIWSVNKFIQYVKELENN